MVAHLLAPKRLRVKGDLLPILRALSRRHGLMTEGTGFLSAPEISPCRGTGYHREGRAAADC